MNGNLIDTNVIIKLLNGDKATVDMFETLNNINISSVTAGELYYGAQKSSRVEANLELFKGFLSEYHIIKIDEGISSVYGELKASLVKQGINIPENDIWIAATAVYYNLTLVTYDEHFKKINRLSLLEI